MPIEKLLQVQLTYSRCHVIHKIPRSRVLPADNIEDVSFLVLWRKLYPPLQKPLLHPLHSPAFHRHRFTTSTVIRGIVHNDKTIGPNIWNQFVGKPILKMFSSHFIMVIACVIFGAKYESGIWYPTILITGSKNDQRRTLSRGPPESNEI